MKFEDQDRSFISPKEWSDVSPLSGKKESGGHDEDLRFRDYLFRNALTGLPNRLKLIHDISVNESPILFIINIDQFNQINNLLGLESGDAILISLGEKLLYHLHDHPGILYKLQADEYAVLMNISGSEPPWAKIEKIANHLITTVQRDRIHVSSGLSPEGYEVALSITIGISCARVVGKENLVTAADIALKTAKNRRLPFLFYRQSEETKRRYERNIHWAKVIRDAVIDDRIVPYYQPILNNVTKKVEKYEALVRLLDDQGIPVLPDEFIELSKAIRMYPEITRVMIRKSFQALRNSPFELSINLKRSGHT